MMPARTAKINTTLIPELKKESAKNDALLNNAKPSKTKPKLKWYPSSMYSSIDPYDVSNAMTTNNAEKQKNQEVVDYNILNIASLQRTIDDRTQKLLGTPLTAANKTKYTSEKTVAEKEKARFLQKNNDLIGGM
jgi:hypothetical protein